MVLNLEWQMQILDPTSGSTAIPESPVICPRNLRASIILYPPAPNHLVSDRKGWWVCTRSYTLSRCSSTELILIGNLHLIQSPTWVESTARPSRTHVGSWVNLLLRFTSLHVVVYIHMKECVFSTCVFCSFEGGRKLEYNVGI